MRSDAAATPGKPLPDNTQMRLMLWMSRPETLRTGKDVATFYRWLIWNRPDLLPADPAYQKLQAELRPYIKE
jgi:hypothetical protein